MSKILLRDVIFVGAVENVNESRVWAVVAKKVNKLSTRTPDVRDPCYEEDAKELYDRIIPNKDLFQEVIRP